MKSILFLCLFTILFFACSNESGKNNVNENEPAELADTSKELVLKADSIVSIDPFKNFLIQFQTSFLQRDKEKLKDLISFPVLVRGSLDSERTYLKEREFLDSFLEQYLQEEDISPCSGYVMSKEDMLNMCKREPRNVGDGMKRSGDFLFTQKDGKWKLVRIYSEIYSAYNK